MIKKIFGFFIILISFALIINIGYAQNVPFIIKLSGDLNFEDTTESFTLKAYVSEISSANLVLNSGVLAYNDFNSSLKDGFFTDPITQNLTGTESKTFPLIIKIEFATPGKSPQKTITISNPNYSGLDYYTDELIENSLNNNKLSVFSITGVKIVDNSITANKIDNIAGSNLIDSAVTGVKIKNNTLSTNNFANYNLGYKDFKILNNNSGNDFLAKNADGSGFVVVGESAITTIGGMEEGAGILKTDNSGTDVFAIKDLGIVNSMINDYAIIGNKFADGAVTTPKIVNNAALESKFQNSAVNTPDLDMMFTQDFANKSLTVNKLSKEALSSLFCSFLDISVDRGGPNIELGVVRSKQNCEFSFSGSKLFVTYSDLQFDNIYNMPSPSNSYNLVDNEDSAKAFCLLRNGKYESKEYKTGTGYIIWSVVDNLWGNNPSNANVIDVITCSFDGVTKYEASGPLGID